MLLREAERGDLTMQLGGVVAALAPPLVKMRSVGVQNRGPVDRFDQEFVDAGRAGEAAAHGRAVQLQLVADRLQRGSLVQQALDQGEPLPGADHQAALAPADVQCPDRCGNGTAVARGRGGGPGAGGFSNTARTQVQWAATVFSTASPTFFHRCQASATCTACGAPVRAPSA